MKTIAFIGLGNMGSGMVANLAASEGLKVVAFDLSKAACDAAAAAGCAIAGSASDAVAEADAVVTMLPAGAHVSSVYENDILPNAQTGTMLIDCSTIDVETARSVAKMATQKGFIAVDAPVSGGTAAAQAGSLAFMVGCDEEVFADVETVLEPMARIVLRAGTSGAGQAAKICNNMLLAVSMIGTCEAFNLAKSLGLDAGKFFDIASQSSGQCWSVTSYCPVEGVGPSTPADRNFEGGFAAAMMLKDLRLAEDASKATTTATPLGGLALSLYTLMAAKGEGTRDFSAMIELLSNTQESPA